MRTSKSCTAIVPTTSRENIDELISLIPTFELCDETKRFIGLLMLTNHLGDCICEAIEKKYGNLAVDKLYEEDFEPHISAILEKTRDYVGLLIYESISTKYNISDKQIII